MELEPTSAFSDDEDGVLAQQAMNEWVDEVNRLLGGSTRRPGQPTSPASDASGSSRTSARKHQQRQSYRIKLPTTPPALTGYRSPLTPSSESSASSAHWLLPGRPSPCPPDCTSGTPGTRPGSRPEVKWRRYQAPLPRQPSPPTIPLPDRPLPDDVPLDAVEGCDLFLPPYLTYEAPKKLPVYLSESQVPDKLVPATHHGMGFLLRAQRGLGP